VRLETGWVPKQGAFSLMASSKLTGPRLEGQWTNTMYNEEGNIVPYKARVDQYDAAQ
jgi:hypothetical protein